jgi:hypothetical protein
MSAYVHERLNAVQTTASISTMSRHPMHAATSKMRISAETTSIAYSQYSVSVDACITQLAKLKGREQIHRNVSPALRSCAAIQITASTANSGKSVNGLGGFVRGASKMGGMLAARTME